MSSVAVIGGGIVGASCALRLARAGHDVTMFNADERGLAASWGNAGHIAIEQVAPLASPSSVRSLPNRLFFRGGPVALPPAMIGTWGPFALRMLAASTRKQSEAGKRALISLLGQASDAWQRLVNDVGHPSLLRLNGHFVAWESPDSAIKGRARWAVSGSGTASFRDVDAIELDRLRERSKAISGAIRFAGTGQIADLGFLSDRLSSALAASGVRTEWRIVDLEVAESGRARVPGASTDVVVLAAGIGSARLMANIGQPVPLIAERGYHIRTRDCDWPADLPPLVFEDRSLIVTRFDDCLQASSFVEFGKADAPPEERKWKRLERHVVELGLAMRPPFERWMGSRPTLPDYLPAIGRSKEVPNLFYAFGHQHMGLTLGPLTGELIAQLVEGGEPTVHLVPFNLGRFGEWLGS
jgi:D-amino-acid dehydrogenase